MTTRWSPGLADDPPRSGWALLRGDGVVIAADDALAELLQLPGGSALVGRSLSSLAAPHAARAVEAAEEALAAEEAWTGPLELVGSGAPIELVAHITPAAGGTSGEAVLRAEVVGRAPEELVDATARLAALQAIEESPSLDTAARAVMQEVARVLPFDWGCVLKFDSHRDGVPDGDGDDGAEVVATYPSAMAGVARGLRWEPLDEAERLLVESAEPSIAGEASRPDDGGAVSPLARLHSYGLRSALRIPLFDGTRIVGAACLLHHREHRFGARDGLAAEALLRGLGPRLGRALAKPPVATPAVGEPADEPVEEPEAAVELEEPAFEPEAEEPQPDDGAEASGRSDDTEPIAATDDEPGGETPPAGEAGEPAAESADEIEAFEAPAAHEVEEVVASIAHELNNPLTAILGYAQMLPTLEDADRDEAVTTIEREAIRAGHIVQNLLYLARRQPPQLSSLDLADLVERMLASRQTELGEQGIEVTVEGAGPLHVRADELQIERAVGQLIDNAVTATAASGEDHGRRVEVRVERRGAVARLAITDNGPGVDDSALPGIFRPFAAGSVRTAGGRGLGLSIADSVARSHEGRLIFERPAEGGARFVIELPIEGSGATED